MRDKIKLMQTSLQGRIISVLVMTVLPIVICFIFINFYTMYLVQQEIYEKNYDLLSSHMQQMDYELNSVAEYLKRLDVSEDYLIGFESDSSSDKYFASAYYKRLISTNVVMFNYVEGVVIYSPQSDEKVYVFNDSVSQSYQERTSAVAFVRENAEAMLSSRGVWKSFLVGDQYYLFYTYKQRNTYFSAWTSMKNLLRFTSAWKLADESDIFIASADGQVMAGSVGPELIKLDDGNNESSYYLAGKNNRYLVTGVSAMHGDFKLMAAANRTAILGPYIVLQVILVAIILIFMLCIPLVLKILQYNIFKPMERVLGAIDHVEAGDLEYQIETQQDNREFQHLIGAFNEMVMQIKDLKIRAYEEELQKQQIMMEYMQVQIEPHFYLNALSMMNTMAQVGDVALIRDLTDNLSQYLRFIAKTKYQAVTVDEELLHIQHYIKIMQIRFGETFQYMEHVAPDLRLLKIPPLLIQTFIENSMKYAFDVYGNTQIEVFIQQDDDTVRIEIHDNGKGYSTEFIEAFSQARQWESEHIGIWNAKMRLFYLYGDAARLWIRNGENGGARTRIDILTGGKNIEAFNSR